MPDSCVIVTGASRGIGAAIATTLARQGYSVACLSRSGAAPSVDEAIDDIRGRLLTVACDVSDAKSVRTAFAEVVGGDLRIVGLVNNAGIHVEGRSEDFSVEEWHRTIDSNATSMVMTCQAVFPHLVASGGGLIVNIGSFFDKLGVKRNMAYCASKAAVGAITRCLAVEWARHRIRVVDVAPGYIMTDLNKAVLSSGPFRAYVEQRIPSREPGMPSDVADLVGVLFGQTGRFLTGETIYIDGAQGISH